MFRKLAFLSIIPLLCFGSTNSNAADMVDKEIVVIRTIDKISAYTHTFEIPVGKTVKFGTSLFIKARACRQASPIDTPENAAFLQIWQRKPSEEVPTWVFSGWMFSSNPSASAMEHPVYDVWVIDCKNEVTSESKDEFIEEQSPDESKSSDKEDPSKIEEEHSEEKEIFSTDD